MSWTKMMRNVERTGRHGPVWHGAGHVWVPHDRARHVTGR